MRKLLVVIAIVLALVVAVRWIQFNAGEAVELRQPVATPPPVATSHPTITPSAEPSVPEVQPTVVPLPVSIAAAPPISVQWIRPGVGLMADYVLGAPLQTTASGEIIPAELETAQWVNDADMGAPGSDTERTVYMAGHTSPNQSAAFNALYDRAASTSHVLAGDEFLVTTEATVAMGLEPLRYVVTGVEAYPKGVVAADAESEVWRIVPGRLVILTCFQNPKGARSVDNFVVYAQYG